MKQLLLMRHAKSSWKQTHLSDDQRPLSKRGLRDLPLMASYLSGEDFIPDHIICSNARRAKDTAERVLMHWFIARPLTLDPGLYTFDGQKLLAKIQSLYDDYNKVMIIGHNPALEEVVCRLCDSAFPGEKFSTAGLVLMTSKCDKWSHLERGSCRLEYFQKPKHFRKEV